MYVYDPGREIHDPLGADMRVLAMVAMTLALVGCATDEPVPESVLKARARAQLEKLEGRVSAAYNYKTLLGYRWNGELYPREDDLARAIEGRVAQNMATLPPVDPVGAGVRVLQPYALMGEAAVARGNRRLVEARIEALRTDALFSTLRVETDGPGKFMAHGGDYALRVGALTWTLKDAEEREISVDDGANLAAFVDNVAMAVGELRGDVEFLRVLKEKPEKSAVVYRDQDYTGLVPLVGAFDRANAALLPQVVAASTPLGGRALLIVPIQAPDMPKLLSGERLTLLDSARKAYRQALDRRFARFVIASKVFASVQVDFANMVEPSPSDFDWVLWREPNAVRWQARPRDGLPIELDLSPQPTGFAAALMMALTVPVMTPEPPMGVMPGGAPEPAPGASIEIAPEAPIENAPEAPRDVAPQAPAQMPPAGALPGDDEPIILAPKG